MDIKEQYIINHKIGSFSQYKVPREQYDARNSILQLSQSKSPKATGNFLNIIQKSAKQTPGPGQYSITKQIPTLQVKKPSKINFQKLQAKGTATYLDSLIKQKSKIPDVGKYQIVIDKTKQIREKYQKKGDNDRKNAPIFRPTILDQINRDTIKVSPSIYEVTKPMGYKSVGGGIQPEHRRTLSLPKLPGSADYRPIPVSFTTFDAKKKQGKAGKNKKSTFGSKDNKKSQSLGPGPKYNLISAWVETKNKYGQKKNRNLFKSLSSLRSPSIYH